MATQTGGPPSNGMDVLAAFDLGAFGDDSMAILDDPMSIQLDNDDDSTTNANPPPANTSGNTTPTPFMSALAISTPDAAMFDAPPNSLDMPLPLSISVTPTGDVPSTNAPAPSTPPPNASISAPVRYVQSPTSQHKRVRSDPGLQQIAQSLQQEHSDQRPSLPTNMLGPDAVSEDELLRPLPINAVDVTTPRGFQDLLRSNEETTAYRKSEPGPEIDAFLQEFGPTAVSPNMFGNINGNGNAASLFLPGESPMNLSLGAAPLSPSGSKRKRDVGGHVRHKSSPEDLFQNQFQLRMMAQQQQMQMPISPFTPNSGYIAALVSPSMMPANTGFDGGMTPPLFSLGPPQNPGLPFQMPNAMNDMLQRRSPVVDASFTRPQRGHHSGLSADMSGMSLEAMIVDTAESPSFQRPRGKSASSPSAPRSPPLRGRKSSDSEQARKAYKCGVCGQPKVGHVCTKPEMRYNWTQVDLEVTRGAKIMNCALICVKSKWIPQHPDNIEH